MDAFWVVTLFHFQPTSEQWANIESMAINDHGSLGIEEFSLDEPEVDALLGERSYSGGDLPQDVLDEVESRVLGRPNNYRFFFGDEEGASEFYTKVGQVYLCESQIETQQTEDWNAEWKKHYAPIKVNDSLEIIPSWNKDYNSTSREKIYIYPGMGFGTGSHETTFLCLKLFTEHLLNQKVETVLDFGSGSGILGLATFKFFPEAKVDFYDIDPEANKNCYQNAETNNLEDHAFRLLLPEVREKLMKEYDVVFANILESILMLEQEALIAHTKKGGSLILSGLLRHQAANIIKLYTDAGMKLISHVEKGDWAAILFKKGEA
ncbi:50S ribosomal protein L11 methyltransferase [Peredibacter sp. HCB2-198]|uniref:50S ribosomal protein L11 methyltransferase n=1 Tax=Peredibacter sp. HCB2-198 TaxID=3383025 RepID=UPI0038B449B7